MFRPLAALQSTVLPALARLCACLCACLCVCSGAGAAPLRAGGFVVAPLVMGETGKPLRGAVRDFLEREVVPAGAAIEWMPPTSLERAYRSLRDGTLDVLLVASGEAVRQPGTTPSTWTYLLTQPHLAVRGDAPLHSVDSLGQLAGMNIGWVAGPALSPGLRKSGARCQRATGPDWQVENLHRLQAGQIDAAYFENEYSPRYLALAAAISIRVVRLPMPPRAFFMLYSSKADKADIARFDRLAGAAFKQRRFRDFVERYTVATAPRP